ncbi:adenylate kinase [Spiroplasma endosymbiont of Clivina fossor]|uniref:adenylate kinase n=1 Tax=Spiroplasma endosymbiont of Clivina fossor TaxID=3066282 RepID=UPI00313E3D16
MNLIFLGAPGSGKGTQSQKLCEAYRLIHLSTGDIIRQAIRNNSPLGLKTKEYLDAGKLVPDEQVINLVRETIDNLSENFILDGFPRTLKQVHALQEILEKKEQQIDFVIYLEADLEHLIDRITNRLVCPTCNRTYSKLINKPKIAMQCDDDDASLIQRDDDTKEKAKIRIQTYLNETLPLVEYYQEENLLHVVDANQSSKLVFNGIKSILDSV